ncbi:MAG: 30S ribosomal protein S9 [Candidatus Aenigmatarchaeota archaeon]
MATKKKIIIGMGKRKKAIARAFVLPGKGNVRINSKPINSVWRGYVLMRAMEPLVLAGNPNDIDINVDVRGGGVWGQADAVRTAIGNALLARLGRGKNKALKDIFLKYDRSILISDARRTERHKPSRSSAGPRRTKQQSKR